MYLKYVENVIPLSKLKARPHYTTENDSGPIQNVLACPHQKVQADLLLKSTPAQVARVAGLAREQNDSGKCTRYYSA